VKDANLASVQEGLKPPEMTDSVTHLSPLKVLPCRMRKVGFFFFVQQQKKVNLQQQQQKS